MKALGWLERLMFLCAAVLLLWPGMAMHGAGLVLFVSLCFWQKLSSGPEVFPEVKKEEPTSAL